MTMHKENTCSVDGCRNKHYSKGYCSRHYHRNRKYGTTLGCRTSHGDPAKWVLGHLNCSQDECLIWPYNMNFGISLITIDGQRESVRRVMKTLVHGAAPSPSYKCRVLCDSGLKGCVNPHHLEWVDPSVSTHHERGWRRKLTESDVLKISERLAAGTRDVRLAEEYSVLPSTINKIKNGQLWSHVTGTRTAGDARR